MEELFLGEEPNERWVWGIATIRGLSSENPGTGSPPWAVDQVRRERGEGVLEEALGGLWLQRGSWRWK